MKEMTTIAALNNMDGRAANDDATPIRRSLRCWNAGLFTSGVLGALSAVLGITMGFVMLLELVVPSTTLYATGTILIGGSFVLFGLMAHCIDKVDAADKALRLQYCREHGLKDEGFERSTK